MKRLFKSWKTTLSGVVLLFSIIAPATGLVTKQQAEAVAGLAASVGLMSAKDSNVTGGSKEQE